MLKDATKIKICKDLAINKYPVGPKGTYKKADYMIQEVYHHVYDRYAKVPQLIINDEMVKHHGYDPAILFDLRLRSENEAINFCWSSLGAKTYSQARRWGRRLWFRIYDGVRKITTVGSEGIWQLCWDRYQRAGKIAFVHAKSESEATILGQTMAGLYGYSMSDEVYTKFISVDEPAAAISYNSKVAQDMVSKAQEKVKHIRERLEQALAALDESKAMAGVVMTSMMFHENLHEDKEV